MEKEKMIRVPRLGKPADRYCPRCNRKLFCDDWPMHTKALLLYADFCFSCGQALDWENPITVEGGPD